MDFEGRYTPEKAKNARERLVSLEKEGKFVFHGSLEKINTLEPRQADGYNKETGQIEKDGEPAVFASQFADLAIFHSLIHPRRYDGGDSAYRAQ